MTPLQAALAALAAQVTKTVASEGSAVTCIQSNAQAVADNAAAVTAINSAVASLAGSEAPLDAAVNPPAPAAV